MVFLLLSFCAEVTGQGLQEINLQTADSALLYIYRERKGENSMISPGIEINGEEKLLLRNGHYTYLKLDSGFYNVSVKLSNRYNGTSNLGINLTRGKSYFVE